MLYNRTDRIYMVLKEIDEEKLKEISQPMLILYQTLKMSLELRIAFAQRKISEFSEY